MLAHVPFDSNLKRSIIVVNHPELENTIRIYVKGAPELVVNNCFNTYNAEGDKVPFSDYEREYLLNDIMRPRMTSKSFRVFGFSIADLTPS